MTFPETAVPMLANPVANLVHLGIITSLFSSLLSLWQFPLWIGFLKIKTRKISMNPKRM